MAYKFEEYKGLDALEELQKHPNVSIYKEVERIISEFFNVEDNNMDWIFKN